MEGVMVLVVLLVGVVLTGVAIVAPVMIVRALSDIRLELRVVADTIAGASDDLSDELREGRGSWVPPE